LKFNKGGLRLFVAPKGDDSWSGTELEARGSDGPLATLERARDILRETGIPRGGATVNILPGDYERQTTLELTEEDSGTADGRVIYTSFGGRVRLLGGRTVSGFVPVSEESIRRRLRRDARKFVMELDLRKWGISDIDRLRSRGFGRSTSPSHMELYFGGKRMVLARWPNEAYAKITTVAEEVSIGDRGQFGRLESGFIFKSDRPAGWETLDNVWVHGYWAYDWANTYEQIDSIDPHTGLVKTRPPHGMYGFKAGQRFYFLNVLEELDSPGEYYIDDDSGKLYFWPPEDPGVSEAAVSILGTPIIRMDGVSNVTMRGLTFEYGRGNGIEVHGGESVKIAGCNLRNLGNNGIVVDGGMHHQICSSDFHDLGDAGIRISGGDRKALIPCNHLVENNHIWQIGQWSRSYQPAVLLDGVGMRVSHNLIHDGPHNAIQLSGNDNVVEYNHIHHVCGESGDVGAFYMGRDWTERGNAVRYNYFHDTQGGAGMGSMAVYLDDCASGTEVKGNVFLRCTRAAFIGGGRDNLVAGNIFIDCEPAVMIDGRGLDKTPHWHKMVYVTMKERLEAVDGWYLPYSERYPHILDLKPYYADDAGVPPEGNAIVSNICSGGKWLTIHWHAEHEMGLVRDNLVSKDPLFLDPDRMDFRPREDSLAYPPGFKAIPLQQIGTYASDDRALTDSGSDP